MNRKVRDRRNTLHKTWVELRARANSSRSIEKGIALRMKEDKVYKLWKFYDEIIKAFD